MDLSLHEFRKREREREREVMIGDEDKLDGYQSYLAMQMLPTHPSTWSSGRLAMTYRRSLIDFPH